MSARSSQDAQVWDDGLDPASILARWPGHVTSQKSGS
jgi:hypothetical protein